MEEKVIVNKDKLVSIADSVRAKMGSGELYNVDELQEAVKTALALGGNAILQSKTVTPTESRQTVTPDSGYGGLSSVTVNAIDTSHVGSGVTRKAAQTYTPSTTVQTIAANQYLSGAQTIAGDADLVAANIRSGVEIFGVTGTYGGSSSGSVSLQSKTVTPSETSQTIAPDSGYDGLSSVTVDAISAQYVGSDIPRKAATTYTPSTSSQTIAAGQFLTGIQEIVGDINLVPANIAKGVSIFGIVGTYEGSDESGTGSGFAGFSAMTTGAFTPTSNITSQYAISHGLGASPDFVVVYIEGQYDVSAFSDCATLYCMVKHSYVNYDTDYAGAYVVVSPYNSNFYPTYMGITSDQSGTFFGASSFVVGVGSYSALKAGTTYRWIAGKLS